MDEVGEVGHWNREDRWNAALEHTLKELAELVERREPETSINFRIRTWFNVIRLIPVLHPRIDAVDLEVEVESCLDYQEEQVCRHHTHMIALKALPEME